MDGAAMLCGAGLLQQTPIQCPCLATEGWQVSLPGLSSVLALCTCREGSTWMQTMLACHAATHSGCHFSASLLQCSTATSWHEPVGWLCDLAAMELVTRAWKLVISAGSLDLRRLPRILPFGQGSQSFVPSAAHKHSLPRLPRLSP